MFCLNVALGNISWRLLFKDEETLKTAELPFLIAAPNHPENCWITAKDDFGQVLRVRRDSIHGVMVEDLDKTKMAHIEMALHQQRMQVMATKMAQTDPALRAGAGTQSPAIISPMTNGGFRPQN